MLEVQMVLLLPRNKLKMGADYEAFLAPVPQLHLGHGCAAGTRARSLRYPALPSTTAAAGSSQRPEIQAFTLFLGWLLQTMLSLLLLLQCSKFKMSCEMQQQGSEAGLFMKSTYMLQSTGTDGCLPGWKFSSRIHKCTLLKDQ